MANNSTPSSIWNFSLPLIIAPPSNTIEQQQQQQSSSSSSGTNGVGERKQRTLRLSINARERRRMHDLNDALDELRSVVCNT
jgi:class B basic helix-loop-helix protein 4/5